MLGHVRIWGMPTVPRRPVAQRVSDRVQARRLRAAELFVAGVRQAEVARQLGVSAQPVSVWRARERAQPDPECAPDLGAERLPACAPELNPVEGLWSSLRPSSWPTSPARPWLR